MYAFLARLMSCGPTTYGKPPDLEDAADEVGKKANTADDPCKDEPAGSSAKAVPAAATATPPPPAAAAARPSPAGGFTTYDEWPPAHPLFTSHDEGWTPPYARQPLAGGFASYDKWPPAHPLFTSHDEGWTPPSAVGGSAHAAPALDLPTGPPPPASPPAPMASDGSSQRRPAEEDSDHLDNDAHMI